jgi:hypothetical protein
VHPKVAPKKTALKNEDRPLPANLDAERYVLHALLSGERIDLLASLSGEDFCDIRHRLILAQLHDLHRNHKPTDDHMVAAELLRLGKLEEAGGASYIVSIAEGIPNGLVVDRYFEIVKDKASRRRVIREAQVIQNRAELDTEDAGDVIRYGINRFQRVQAECAVGPQEIDTDEILSTVGAFPKEAWRGVFGDYRHAMDGTTEASDAAHFATLWAAIAVALGRNVQMFSGDTIYPNVYLSIFGASGDKKTTAERRILSAGLLADHPQVKIIKNVGSTEGLADKVSDAETGVFLFYWEEFASLLARARWTGSTLMEFITECFDCPETWGTSYRKKNKNSIELVQPTPTILTATTTEWFWKYARPEDFFGGFGNRLFFMCGSKKEPIADPIEPFPSDLGPVKSALLGIKDLKPCRARWSAAAQKDWQGFYADLQTREQSGLLEAATKRLHVYVRKLAMAYAAVEGSLPEISRDQLQAAISVIDYGARCTERLIDLQAAQSKPLGELEQRFKAWIAKHQGDRVRRLQQKMHRYCGDAETYNRVLQSLRVAEVIKVEDHRVYLT